MTLEKKLYEMRKSANLTQEQVADKLNVTRQTVSNWENGTAVPSIIKAGELATLYGKTLNDFSDTQDAALSPLLKSWEGHDVEIQMEDSIQLLKGRLIEIESDWFTLQVSDKKGNKDTYIRKTDKIVSLRGVQL